MKRALLFPGQGSETPRMGLDLAARSAAARALLEQAGAQTGVDLWKLLERGGRALDRTEVMQPAIIAVCLGVLAELRAMGVETHFAAGHSLGEVAAWCGAGGIDAETAVDLAVTRGRLMAEAARARPGGMVALRDMTEQQVAAAIEVGRARGFVELGAHNAPTDWVLTGDHEALRAVAAAYPTMQVRVMGPWHCSAMAAAREAFAERLETVAWSAGHAAFVSSVSGCVAKPEEIPGLQADQLTRPLRWAEAMRTLVDSGVTEMIVVGPAKLLHALARMNAGPDVTIHCAADADDLRCLKETLR